MGKLNGPDHYFFGVIDAAALGFNRFEFRELEGKVGQEMYIFGDDFTFAAAPAAIRYHVSALNGSDLSGDGSAADPWQNIAYAVSEIDAQTVPATLLITVDTYPESVVIDKPGGLYHLSGGWDEAFQSRSGVSSVDGMLVIRGVSVLVSDLVLQ